LIDLYAKKIIQSTKMFEREGMIELLNKGLQKRRVIAGDNDIIHINQQINSVALRLVSKQGGITLLR
jgi:hypothetical protein